MSTVRTRSIILAVTAAALPAFAAPALAGPRRIARGSDHDVTIKVFASAGGEQLSYVVASTADRPIRVRAAVAVYEGDGLIEECPVELALPPRGHVSGTVTCAGGWDQLGVELVRVPDPTPR